MDIIAKTKNARMSPRKLRSLRGVVIGLSVHDAEAQLMFMPDKSAKIILKVLHSAMANAKNNFDIDTKKLIVSDLVINEGFVMKRHEPVSRGMAHPILKRTSHVAVVLEEVGADKSKVRKGKKTKIDTVTEEQHIKGQLEEKSDTKKEVVNKKSMAGKQESKRDRKSVTQDSIKKNHRRKTIGE